jgi:two-component system sensor histidine kinase PilS (NtrC family)
MGTKQDYRYFSGSDTDKKNSKRKCNIRKMGRNRRTVSKYAHEIRNPLASLKGSIEMLREDKLPEKHKERLMVIALSEMERLNNVISDFLTYSSPRPLEVQRIDLDSLLVRKLDLLKNAEHKGGISIKKNYEGQLFIQADPEKLSQVFWNLGVNAFEAMGSEGELTVSTKNNRDNLIISFSDTGPGISKSDIDKIFYPFFTTKERGTGLGLSIAYRIIEEHNGRLAVTSRSGFKTTFEIILEHSYENH